MERSKAIYYFRVVFCLYAWSAFILTFNELDDLKYFTMQTNLFICVWLTLAIAWMHKPDKFTLIDGPVHGALTGYITITFLIYSSVLAPMYTFAENFTYSNIGIHYTIPILTIIDWVITANTIRYSWKNLGLYLIYPICYLGFALIFGEISGTPIYPFFDVAEKGWVSVIMWSIFLIVLGLVMSTLIIGINRKRTQDKKSP